MPRLPPADPRSVNSARFWIHHGYHNNKHLCCLHFISLQLTSDQSYSTSMALEAILVHPPHLGHLLHIGLERHLTQSRTESPYPGHCLSLTQWPFRFLPCRHKMGGECCFLLFSGMAFFGSKIDLCRDISMHSLKWLPFCLKREKDNREIAKCTIK